MLRICFNVRQHCCFLIAHHTVSHVELRSDTLTHTYSHRDKHTHTLRTLPHTDKLALTYVRVRAVEKITLYKKNTFCIDFCHAAKLARTSM